MIYFATSCCIIHYVGFCLGNRCSRHTCKVQFLKSKFSRKEFKESVSKRWNTFFDVDLNQRLLCRSGSLYHLVFSHCQTWKERLALTPLINKTYHEPNELCLICFFGPEEPPMKCDECQAHKHVLTITVRTTSSMLSSETLNCWTLKVFVRRIW